MKRLLIISLLVLIRIINPSAQIPVEEEPLHHTIYEDEYHRVLEIIVQPGDTALMHEHRYNYCYIALKGGRMWLEDKGKDPRTVNLPDHYCGGKFQLEDNPFVHRFANIDSMPIRFFTVEHKRISSAELHIPMLDKDVLLSNNLFLVSRQSIDAYEELVITTDRITYVVNLTEDAPIMVNGSLMNYWKRFEADERVSFINQDHNTSSFVIFEVR